MIELNLMIRFSSLYKVFAGSDTDLVEKKLAILKKIKAYRIFTIIMAVLLLAVCAILTILVDSNLNVNPETFISVTSTTFLIVSILLLVWLILILKLAGVRFEGEF